MNMLFDELDDLQDADEELNPATSTETVSTNALLPPAQATDLIGHDDIDIQLNGLVDSARMPHALIFAGPEGIGKTTMAFRLARRLLKQNNDDEGAGKLISSGAHPNLLFIQREYDEKKGRFKGSIGIDQVRRIGPFMHMTASRGAWRIVIVDDADSMGWEAQNAILKILEEPPANALLILIAHRPGLFVPTIRSRCRVMTFRSLNRDSFGVIMKRGQPNLTGRDIDTLYAVSRGSAGTGLRLAAEGGLEAVRRVIATLHQWPQWDWPGIHMLSEELSRPGQEENYQAFCGVLLWILESFARAHATGGSTEDLPEPLRLDALKPLFSYYSLEDWVKICENLKNHFETVEQGNLDKYQAILGAFSQFDNRVAA